MGEMNESFVKCSVTTKRLPVLYSLLSVTSPSQSMSLVTKHNTSARKLSKALLGSVRVTVGVVRVLGLVLGLVWPLDRNFILVTSPICNLLLAETVDGAVVV